MNDDRDAFLLEQQTRQPLELLCALRRRSCGAETLPPRGGRFAPAVQPLNERLCLVFPDRLGQDRPDEETLRRLCALCGEPEADAACLSALAREGRLPVSEEDALRAAEDWRSAGYPLGLSESGERCLALRREHARLLPLFARLDRLLAAKPRVIAAIDGGSASGKTTAAALLEEVYGCAVFHMDDFFLRPEQRSAARLREPGGNVDWERFRSEVLAPLTRGEEVRFRRYDCRTQTLEPPRAVPARALSVVEGAYSMRPELAPAYDLSVFFSITPAEQHRRIRLRNPPAMQAMFCALWVPLENLYFEKLDVPSRCGLILNAEELPAPGRGGARKVL